jgi:hypothetical protein
MPCHAQQIFEAVHDRNLLKLAGVVLGGRPVPLTENCSPRLQRPSEPDRSRALHQDVVAAEVTSPQQSGLTFWVPPTPLDRRAPTLKILPFNNMRELPRHEHDDQG